MYAITGIDIHQLISIFLFTFLSNSIPVHNLNTYTKICSKTKETILLRETICDTSQGKPGSHGYTWLGVHCPGPGKGFFLFPHGLFCKSFEHLKMPHCAAVSLVSVTTVSLAVSAGTPPFLALVGTHGGKLQMVFFTLSPHLFTQIYPQNTSTCLERVPFANPQRIGTSGIRCDEYRPGRSRSRSLRGLPARGTGYNPCQPHTVIRFLKRKTAYNYHYFGILTFPLSPAPLLSLFSIQNNLPTPPGNVIVLGHRLLRLVPAQLNPNG